MIFKNSFFWLYTVLYLVSLIFLWSYGWKLVIGVMIFGWAMRVEDLYKRSEEKP